VRPRKTRGTSLVAVLGVLALLAMAMAVMAQLLMTNLGQTRRRATALYATELAHSGIDWARASLLSGRPFERKILKVRGGEIDVRTEAGEAAEAGAVRIVSTGRVVEGEAALASRQEVLTLGPVQREVRVPQ
jgi:hypothetical protein